MLPPRDAVDHEPGRAQRWPDVDDDLRRWIGAAVDALHGLDELAGMYLHGSLAMGGFHRPKSDVDLIAVVDAPVSDERASTLAVALLDVFDRRPITGGLELSVMPRGAIESFEHPAPFEFHFSEAWVEHLRAGGAAPRGVDPDLAAHCTVARARGIPLVGPDPTELFGEVPRAAYLDSIVDDLRWIVAGGIVESPFYGVLNICRCALELIDGVAEPPSKTEAAIWALDRLPAEHHPVIAAALECYRAAGRVAAELRAVHGHAWDEEPLLAIAAWAKHALLAG